MRSLSRPSPAKINLTLRVGPTRSDGFHEIESLVARVGLCDTVRVTARDDRQLTLSCDDPSIPDDETNLALRAARRLAEAAGAGERGVDIALEKRIPAGSGLGGGSSNAATALMLLNELWETGLSSAELARISAQLGSDVPLFFHSPLCIARGRGELIEDVHKALPGWIVLVMPPVHSTTRDVYAAWDQLASHPQRPLPEEVSRKTTSAAALMPHLFNDLEAAAFQVNPMLSELSERLNGLAGGPVRMTGSGSAFFRLFDERQDADALAERVRGELSVPMEVVPLRTTE